MSHHLSILGASVTSLALFVTPAAQAETYTQAASSFNHTCAIYGSGGLHCWGLNASGQLGDGTTTNSAIPVVVPGLTGVTSVSAGRVHTCALTQGVVKCWGDNSLGQRGAAPFGAGNPLSAPIGVVKCSLDLDGDGQVLATTDAVLMARAALGYSGAALTINALASAAPRRTSVDLRSFLIGSCGMALPPTD